MHISKNGLDLIKKYEGLYLSAYKCPAGVLTIGYGTTNADKEITLFTINNKTKITKEKAEELLKKSIEKKYEPLVNKFNNKYKFNQNEFDALVSFCYNIGSINQLTRNGKRTKQEIADAMLKYDHAAGRVLNGLTKRRKEERTLFLKKIKQEVKQEVKQEEVKNNINYVVVSTGLNVRSGAGMKYKVTNVLAKGNEVYIDKIDGNWGRVQELRVCGRVQKLKGWVCMKYVKKIKQ